MRDELGETRRFLSDNPICRDNLDSLLRKLLSERYNPLKAVLGGCILRMTTMTARGDNIDKALQELKKLISNMTDCSKCRCQQQENIKVFLEKRSFIPVASVSEVMGYEAKVVLLDQQDAFCPTMRSYALAGKALSRAMCMGVVILNKQQFDAVVSFFEHNRFLQNFKEFET